MIATKKARLMVAAGVVVLATASCSAVDSANERRGRGDAPVGTVDDTAKEVIQMPDRFSNVAHACDGHGHRVFVTTKSDSSRMLQVIDDPSCGPASVETRQPTIDEQDSGGGN